MTRIQALIGCAAVAGIAIVTAHASARLTAAAHAAETQDCTPGVMSPEQKARRREAIVFARQINTEEARTFFKTRVYQPLSAYPQIAVPQRMSAQLVFSDSGYIFTVKDNDDPCHFALFSDQAGVIYTGQPLQ